MCFGLSKERCRRKLQYEITPKTIAKSVEEMTGDDNCEESFSGRFVTFKAGSYI